MKISSFLIQILFPIEDAKLIISFIISITGYIR